MRPLGILLVIVALLVPAWGLAGLPSREGPLELLRDYIGIVALITMAIAQLLATRFRWLETIFGGMDRIYVLHKWLGIGALAAVVLHSSIEGEEGGRESALSDLAEGLGEFSYNGLLVLIAITLVRVLPYHWWAWTHKFIGAFFVVGAAHFVLIEKSFALTHPLSLYVLAICAIGTLAYIYNVAPFGRRLARHRYKVATVVPRGDAVAVTLTPERSGMHHRAGQFAFVSFDQAGLREAHPFTISDAPNAERTLRFTIKALGNATEELRRRLKPGMLARVEGPHGRFFRRSRAKQEVWIAGGIGVTPFVAWAGALDDTSSPIHIYYCVRGRETAVHLDTLEDVAARLPNVTLSLIDSAAPAPSAGDTAPLPRRLTARHVVENLNAPLARTNVYFCGPKAMRDALRSDLRGLGLASRRFHYEEFEILTGIGLLDRLVDAIKARLGLSRLWPFASPELKRRPG